MLWGRVVSSTPQNSIRDTFLSERSDPHQESEMSAAPWLRKLRAHMEFSDELGATSMDSFAGESGVVIVRIGKNHCSGCSVSPRQNDGQAFLE